MPLDWQAVVDQLTNVQKLVHLAARYDSVDEERIRTELLSMRRKGYNDELEIQAAHVGCAGQRGRLDNGSILTELNASGAKDAESIANTYNYFMAQEIIRAREENVRGNRFYYASKLRTWNPTYWNFKDTQIAQFTDLDARAKAQQDFYRFNGQFGTAKLQPRTAVCPICKGWIKRGVVPLRVAVNNPPPYHLNCFPPNARVNIPEGRVRRIINCSEGDIVSTRLGNCRVKDVFVRETVEQMYRFIIDRRLIEITGDHPVYTPRGWRPARDLMEGDLVRVLRNCFVPILSKGVFAYKGRVYNLETENGEYAVNGVIVHNCPHTWETRPAKVAKEDCPLLWMGE